MIFLLHPGQYTQRRAMHSVLLQRSVGQFGHQYHASSIKLKRFGIDRLDYRRHLNHSITQSNLKKTEDVTASQKQMTLWHTTHVHNIRQDYVQRCISKKFYIVKFQ